MNAMMNARMNELLINETKSKMIVNELVNEG